MAHTMNRTKTITIQISEGETVSGHNTISSIVPTTNLALATTAKAHGYRADQKVRISGCTGGDAVIYNGIFKILTVPSTTTFTYDTIQTPAGSAAGSLVADKDEDVTGYALAAISLPASFTGTALTFQGDIDGTDTYQPLHESDAAGIALSWVVAAGRICYPSATDVVLNGLCGLKAVSGSSEAAARLVKLHLVRQND